MEGVGREGLRRGEGGVSVYKCDYLGEEASSNMENPTTKKEECSYMCVEDYIDVIP